MRRCNYVDVYCDGGFQEQPGDGGRRRGLGGRHRPGQGPAGNDPALAVPAPRRHRSLRPAGLPVAAHAGHGLFARSLCKHA